MTSRASRSGELAMRALPAVLLDLHEDLATGKLVLRRGRITKVVDLLNGNPVSSTSSTRDETLGHFLVNAGVIDEAQHRSAVQRAADSKTKLGEALVAMRLLTIEGLVEQLGRQARHKIIQALRWPQGAWRFDESNESVEGIQLRMVEVVLGGLRETAVELDRLTRLDSQTFELTERGSRLRLELKRTFGDAAVSLLAVGAPMAELEKVFPDRAQARIAIDAMLLCDAVTARLEYLGLGSRTGAQEEGSSPEHTLPGATQFSRVPTRPQAPGSVLFDILFDDNAEGGTQTNAGAAPLDFIGEESGVVSIADVTAAAEGRDLTALARQSVAAEHQRVRGADHYAVLMIGRKAVANEIDAAHQIRTALLDRDTAGVVDPKDKKRVDEIHEAYDTAKRVLCDDRRRLIYDRELAGGELVQVAPAINTELSFRIAEDLMAKRQWASAIGHIKTVLAQAPNEADYHAALGLAEWMAGGEKAEPPGASAKPPGPGAPTDAAEVAKGHLNQALAINPDHPAAHEYLGRIAAKLGATDDSDALFHLERALDLDPGRLEAAIAIEQLLISRGELRRLERVLKRLLFKLRGRSTPAEAKGWARLARLYYDHLDDPVAAAAAAANARKIAPKDSDVAALIARSSAAIPPADNDPIRAGWAEALAETRSGAALVRSTEASGHADAAFLAAQTMVALGTADAAMAALYEARRVRGVVSPTRPFDRDQWALLRHKEDTVELGALMELAAPAVHALSPMTPGDFDLDPSQLLAEADVPPAFARVRARYAELLGVPVAPVYAKVELGRQIHVVATDPPVLVAGDEALTAPERPELAFRLARAMTFLWPGRAVGASRPGRVLRAIVMAIFREASGSDIGGDEALAPAATEAIRVLGDKARAQAHAAALRIMSRGAGLNLTAWAKGLSRTADRAGMLLCGDVPSAFAGAREVGELDKDLVEFSYSAAHVHLRRQLGLV